MIKKIQDAVIWCSEDHPFTAIHKCAEHKLILGIRLGPTISLVDEITETDFLTITELAERWGNATLPNFNIFKQFKHFMQREFCINITYYSNDIRAYEYEIELGMENHYTKDRNPINLYSKTVDTHVRTCMELAFHEFQSKESYNLLHIAHCGIHVYIIKDKEPGYKIEITSALGIGSISSRLLPDSYPVELSSFIRHTKDFIVGLKEGIAYLYDKLQADVGVFEHTVQLFLTNLKDDGDPNFKIIYDILIKRMSDYIITIDSTDDDGTDGDYSLFNLPYQLSIQYSISEGIYDITIVTTDENGKISARWITDPETKLILEDIL